VTPAGIVLAIAVAAWGAAPAPPPDKAPAVTQPAPSPAPAEGAVQPIAPPSPAPARPASVRPSLIVRGPLDVRARPIVVDTPDRSARKPLYKNWGFWVVSGGIFVATIIVTIVATRPGPEPYVGNAPPYYVGLP